MKIPSAKRYQPKKYVKIHQPEWIKNATIYEVNVRQFSKEGNFEAVQHQLPRLKKMGIDIIWLMPIHPIGILKRKGTLGSYYSVKDHLDINPEFGTRKDFENLVKAVHQEEMYIIIDWVANHSSCDNNLVKTNPDWYKKSQEGKFRSTPWRDYDDIINFDYNNPELRKYMTDALKFWIREFDIDGYRCDLAGFVPIDFWENVRAELEEIKPVFMLAEAEDKELHRKAFDATYNWTLWNNLHQIALQNKTAKMLAEDYIAEHVSTFPKEGIRMNFIDNHDKNSWEGNVDKNFGDALQAVIVFNAVMDGMPLVYNGEEAGLNHSLKFFEKDPIHWRPHSNEKLYSVLFNLKHKNQALWNGKWGGEMVRIINDKMENIFSFSREKNGDKVLAFFNFSPENIIVTFETILYEGIFTDLFTGNTIPLNSNLQLEMKPWDYVILHQSKTNKS